MAREISLDFTDTPPAQGTGGSDHIPPGKYLCEITNFDDGTSKSSGKRMLTGNWIVADGNLIGKKLLERFVLEGDDGKPTFGAQRLHACLLAHGVPVTQKVVRIDLDRLAGLRAVLEVDDEEVPARDKYEARVTSRIRAFYPVQAAKPKAAAPAATKAEPAPAPAPEPEAIAMPEPVAVAAAPAAAPETTVAQDIDNLFD